MSQSKNASALIPFANFNHKVLVVVLDGIGAKSLDASVTASLLQKKGVLPETPFLQGNAVCAAYTPNLTSLTQGKLYRTLFAHGPSVGLPSADDMGNSEVGHNALGAGRIFAQGAKLVNQAIASGSLFEGAGWKKTVDRPELKQGTATLHLCGLLSDGNVHSHIDHLFALISAAKDCGVRRVRLHPLLDGRDVGPTTALDYVDKLESFLSALTDDKFDARVASSGGRTVVTMDRYESDWQIVERGYNAHVLGEGRQFACLREAVEVLRKETNLSDQNLPPIVIAQNGIPVGPVEDGDSFILFNFRGDRAIQISRALTESEFSGFVRKKFPKVHFAGMMQYDGDLHLPEVFLVNPPSIENTMGELLANAQVPQFACSETQKYGHVTYFWNGNRSGKFNDDLETYLEIASDVVSFEMKPWMKASEIADATIDAMRQNAFRVGRINFANGDMVGHTGDFAATVISVSVVDLALGRILQAAKETDTVVLITADHGNADEMYETDKKTGLSVLDSTGLPKQKTSHTLSPVPFAVFNSEILTRYNQYDLNKNIADFDENSSLQISLRQDLPNAGLANVAATVLELAGFLAPDFYEPSLIEWHGLKKKVVGSANH